MVYQAAFLSLYELNKIFIMQPLAVYHLSQKLSLYAYF